MSAYSDLILTHGPTAYWRLNDSEGTVAADSVGTNHGLYEGEPNLLVPSLLTAEAGTSVALNGVDQWVVLPAPVIGKTSGAYTVEVWAKLNTTTTRGRIMVLGNEGDYSVLITANDDDVPGRVGVIVITSTGNIVLAVNNVDVLQAHHYAVTASNNGFARLYIDGTQVAAAAVVTLSFIPTFLDNPAQNVVGASRGTPRSRQLDGVVAEVAVYNRALTPAEILEHYTVGTTEPTPENNPVSGQPAITGTPTEGQTLTAGTSGITDADGLGAFSYQWLADAVAISGATSATYTLTQAEVGDSITVTVSFTDGAGNAESTTSAAVGPVAAASVPDPDPEPSTGRVYRVESTIAETEYEWILLVKADGD
jgi:hypothetical protein